MPPVVYSIFAHKNPRQVLRLIRSLHPQVHIIDLTVFGAKRGEEQDAWSSIAAECGEGRISLTFTRPGGWGVFRQVEETIHAMERTAGRDYSYFINLSGQCYPLAPPDVIRDNFSHQGPAYLHYQDFSASPKEWAKFGDRIECRYLFNPATYLLRWRPMAQLLSRLKGEELRPDRNYFIRIKRLKRGIPGGLRPFKGSNWFCLPKSHVDCILQYIDSHPEYVRFFRSSGLPDEQFFHTILLNSPLRDDIVNDNLRFIDWEKHAGQFPAILTADDADRLFASKKLFARKFDETVDDRILDLIDERRTTGDRHRESAT